MHTGHPLSTRSSSRKQTKIFSNLEGMGLSSQLLTILTDAIIQVIPCGVLVAIDLIALQSMASPSIVNTREHHNMIMLLWDHAMPKKRAKSTVYNLPQLQVPHCTIQYELCITLSKLPSPMHAINTSTHPTNPHCLYPWSMNQAMK
jgi:hypothetical protein